MTYRGHVKNGMIVLDEAVDLRDGTLVVVSVQSAASEDASAQAGPFSERYARVIGCAKGLPPDAAENHDHYLYGSPKR